MPSRRAAPSATPADEPAALSPPAPPVKDWQAEVSARLHGYRRRQARLQGGAEPNPNLDFDFEAQDASADPPNAKILDFPSPGFSAPPLPPIDLEEDEAPSDDLSAEPDRMDSWAGSAPVEQSPPPETAPEPRPLEIILETPSPASEGLLTGELKGPLAVAPLSKRFVAAILDTVVLGAAGGLFALIFWRAGGRLAKTPLDIAVVGFIAAFFIFVYFAAFTIFTAATPGLAAMGLEVRSNQGGAPTLRDSFWRGVGYLVSLAPLMLGFLWALVDTESLTWHDRMSETFIAHAEPNREEVFVPSADL